MPEAEDIDSGRLGYLIVRVKGSKMTMTYKAKKCIFSSDGKMRNANAPYKELDEFNAYQ